MYGDNAIKFNLEEYYNYLEYLRKIGYTDEFINALQTIVIPHKNENIYQYLDELSEEQIYHSREHVYKYVRK